MLTDNGVTESPKSTLRKTQGTLLRELYEWSGLSQEKFCARIKSSPEDKKGLSRTWLFQNIEKKKIEPKQITAICKAYHIPKEYFDGKYELPLVAPSQLNDPQGEYITRATMLEKENLTLRKQLNEKDNEIIELQKKVIKLLEGQ